MAKVLRRAEPVPFNLNALVRIPATRDAIYVFWSKSKSRAVYVGKTERGVARRLREHLIRCHNVILGGWIAHDAEDLIVCYATAPKELIERLERRLIRCLDPVANDKLKR